MYLPHHFEETRVEELHRVISEYALGTLVFKLSQNREERDRMNAAEELHKRGEQVMSIAMRNAAVTRK